jgi:hypothetical protein
MTQTNGSATLQPERTTRNERYLLEQYRARLLSELAEVEREIGAIDGSFRSN